MAYRRPADEWGVVIQKQAEINKQREAEERERMRQEKELYRRDLEFQQKLREMQREQERKQKEQEANELSHRLQVFKEQETEKRMQEAELKKYMAEDYMNHHNFLKQRNQQEKLTKKQEEELQLQRVKAQMDEEKRRQMEFKERLKAEEEAVRNMRYHQELQRRQQFEQEKNYELELARQRAAREEEKERQYKEYYRKLSEDQHNQFMRYNQSVASKINQKDHQLNQWIERNVQNQQALQAQKEEYERRLREQNISNVNQTLRAQLEEKEMQKRYQKDNFLKEAGELDRKIYESKRIEAEREQQRKMAQMQYQEQLKTQAAINQDLKLSTYKLSEHERRLNKHVLDDGRSQLQRGAQNMLKPSSNSSWEENARKFYGSGTNTPITTNRNKNFDPFEKPNKVSPFGSYDKPAAGARANRYM